MALSAAALEGEILKELKSQNFVTSGEHAMAGKLAKAIASAVVIHITSNAEVQASSSQCTSTGKVL